MRLPPRPNILLSPLVTLGLALLAARGHAWTSIPVGQALDVAPVATATDAAGNVLIAGTLANASGGSDFTVVKLDGTSGAEVWRRTIKGTATASDDGAAAVAVDAAGNVVAAGQTENLTSGLDFTVVKLAGSDGTPLWAAPALIDGTAHGFDAASGVALDASGDVFAVGYTQNTATLFDFTVVKVAGASGAALWPAPVALNGTAGAGDFADAVAVDAAGDVVAVGRMRNANKGLSDFTVVKLAGADGALRWPQRFHLSGSGPGDEEALAVAVDAAGNVIAAGYTDNGATGLDLTVVKLAAANGASLWPAPALIDGDGGIDVDEDMARAVALDAGGNVLATGVTVDAGVDVDVFHFTTVKLAAADGAELWRQAVPGTVAEPSSDEGTGVAADAAGNALVAGRVQNTGAGLDFVVAALAAAGGAELFRTELAGTAGGKDEALALIRDPSGNVVAAGRTDNTGSGRQLVAVKIGCAGGAPVVCAAAAPGPCQMGGACNPTTGACGGPLPDGTPCSDADGCTQGDGCQAGVCVGSPVVCTPAPCTAAGSCDPASGQCTAEPLPDGAGCEDGDPCTQDEGCLAGMCVPADSEALVCDLSGALVAPDCAGDRIPRGVRRNLSRARTLVERAAGEPVAAIANRLLGKAGRKLTTAGAGVERAARRRRRPLSAGCAETLRTTIAEGRQRLARLTR